eukprot:449506_1
MNSTLSHKLSHKKLLSKIFTKILKEPQNEKYQRLNVLTISKKLNNCSVCNCILTNCFKKSNDGQHLIFDKQTNKPIQFTKQIKLLLKICSNILSNPSEPKYHKLNCNKIQNKLQHSIAIFICLLLCVGFNQSDNGQTLQWQRTDDNINLLKELSNNLNIDFTVRGDGNEANQKKQSHVTSYQSDNQYRARNESKENPHRQNHLQILQSTKSNQNKFDEDIVNQLVLLELGTREQCIQASSMINNYKDVSAVYDKLEELLQQTEDDDVQERKSNLEHFNDRHGKASKSVLLNIFNNVLQDPENVKYNKLDFKRIVNELEQCGICVDILQNSGFGKITTIYPVQEVHFEFSREKLNGLKIMKTEFLDSSYMAHGNDQYKCICGKYFVKIVLPRDRSKLYGGLEARCNECLSKSCYHDVFWHCNEEGIESMLEHRYGMDVCKNCIAKYPTKELTRDPSSNNSVETEKQKRITKFVNEFATARKKIIESSRRQHVTQMQSISIHTNRVNLNHQIETILVRNIDVEVSTMLCEQLIASQTIDNKSYITSDVDEQLLILVQFKYIIDLHTIKLFAISTDNNDSATPMSVHIYKAKDLNIDFDDLHAMTSSKTIHCTTSGLENGQNIDLQNISMFRRVHTIVIHIESNQKHAEKSHINGIAFHGSIPEHKEYMIPIVFDKSDSNHLTAFEAVSKNIDYAMKIPQNDSMYLLGAEFKEFERRRKSSRQFDEQVIKRLQNLGIANRQQCIKASMMTDNYKDGNAVFENLHNVLDEHIDNKNDDSLSNNQYDENVVNNLIQLNIASREECIMASKLSADATNPYVVFATLEQLINKSDEKQKETRKISCVGELSSCTKLKRIVVVLQHYHQFIKEHHYNSNQNTENESSVVIDNIYPDNYSSTQCMTDFHHLLQRHSHQFEEIYNILKNDCNDQQLCSLSYCLIMKRNYRDRSMLRENDDALKNVYLNCNIDDILKQQILDKIHCHYFHSVDLGYRLSDKERLQIQDKIEDSKDHSTEHDKVACAITEHITNKKLAYSKVGGLDQMKSASKYVTTFSEGAVGFNYSYGVRFFYWNFYRFNISMYDPAKYNNQYFPEETNKGYLLCEFYVGAKFQNIEDELINNPICAISKLQWNIWLKKANVHADTQHFRSRICVVKNAKTYYNLPKNISVTYEHLAAVMVYCNQDQLQGKFGKTCRRIPMDESNESIVSRHSNYAHLARLLREVVECFVAVTTFSGEYNTFWRQGSANYYHGMSVQSQFPSVRACIKGPVSATYSYCVAVNFSSPTGMILQFDPDTNWLRRDARTNWGVYTLECQELSDYPYEQEVFFFGGIGNFIFRNIIRIHGGAKNYELYVQSLVLLSQFCYGLHMNYIGNMHDSKSDIFGAAKQKLCCLMISTELSKHYPDDKKYYEFTSMPEYARGLAQHHIESIICICFSSGNGLMEQMDSYLLVSCGLLNKFFASLFLYDNGWIKLDVLNTLFPKLERIEFSLQKNNNKFCENTAIYLSLFSLRQTNPHSSLQKIDIGIPNCKDVVDRATKIVAEFKPQCVEFRWNVYVHSNITEIDGRSFICVRSISTEYFINMRNEKLQAVVNEIINN